MVLKVPYNFGDFQGISWKKKRDFSVLANPSVVNRTMGNEAAKVLLIETNLNTVSNICVQEWYYIITRAWKIIDVYYKE